MATIRFRSEPTTDSAHVKIDYKAGVIRGVSVVQAVEALGHEMLLDSITLQQVSAAINAEAVGVKSRFTHPGMCADGLGTQLGKVRNASVVGDKVLGDLHLSQFSKHSPKGDLYSYVLELAKDSPADFGLSIVFEPVLAWKMPDGSERPAKRDDEGAWLRPIGATTSKPFARVKKLAAVDVVGEPAANRDGLFSGTGSELSADLFPELDRLLQVKGVSLERAKGFMDRYFQVRLSRRPPAPIAHPPKTGDLVADVERVLSALGRPRQIGPTPLEAEALRLRQVLARVSR